MSLYFFMFLILVKKKKKKKTNLVILTYVKPLKCTRHVSKGFI